MSAKIKTMPFTTSSLCMELEYATLLELSTFRPFEVGRKGGQGIAYLLFERFQLLVTNKVASRAVRRRSEENRNDLSRTVEYQLLPRPITRKTFPEIYNKAFEFGLKETEAPLLFSTYIMKSPLPYFAGESHRDYGNRTQKTKEPRRKVGLFAMHSFRPYFLSFLIQFLVSAQWLNSYSIHSHRRNI